MSKYVHILHNFINDEDCFDLINHFNYLEDNKKLINRGDGKLCAINSKDVVFTNMVNKYYKKVRSQFNDKYQNISGYILTIYNEGIGMAPHIDCKEGEEFGALFYPNDDYNGGGGGGGHGVFSGSGWTYGSYGGCGGPGQILVYVR